MPPSPVRTMHDGSEDMPHFLRAIIAALVLSLYAGQILSAGSVHAAPADGAGAQLSTPLRHLVQDGDGLFGIPCPTDQFYACWVEPYGRRVCGCWQGGDRPACPSGYHYACRIAPDGRRTCACY